MPIKPSIQKQLFALSRNRCAFPNCTNPLFDEGRNLVGEICHIEGEKPDSKRYNRSQTAEERSAFENLIVLCRNHHKLIDSDELIYSVETLKKMKHNHENLTNLRLLVNLLKNVVDKLEIVIHWINNVPMINNWRLRDIAYPNPNGTVQVSEAPSEIINLFGEIERLIIQLNGLYSHDLQVTYGLPPKLFSGLGILEELFDNDNASVFNRHYAQMQDMLKKLKGDLQYPL